jgi:SAM-dependent methyltransferase
MGGVYRSEPRRGARSEGVRPRARSEVVRRGGALELRVDGTFASLYRADTPRTGSVWDALAAPVLALPPARRRRVLILGLGGGSAARLVRALAPRARIVGVEIDPQVVALARRWFGLGELGIEVVRADAERFLLRCRERFDAVLEDVFVGPGRAVRKPDWMLERGLGLAAARVARGGVLASNALDEAPAVERLLAPRFPRALRIGVAEFDNRILVGGPPALSARGLRAAVAASPVLGPSVAALRFRSVAPGGGGRAASRGRARSGLAP